MNGVGLVVPVKPVAVGKSRLRGVHARHADLALALALDTLEAALGASRVRAVVVVTDEPLLSLPGITVVPDPGAGLNGAYEYGAKHLPEHLARAALQADLPALTPGELDEALAVETRAYVADADGTGTTLLLAPPGTPLDPRFGPGSAAAHLASGAVAVTAPLPGLRRDVDTAADLRRADELGVGPRTRALLLGGGPDRQF